MGIVSVTSGEEGRLIVRFSSSPDRASTIKKISGRKWHPDMGYWSVIKTEKMLDKLQSCFCGDRIAASKEIIGSFLGLPEEKTSVIVSEYDVVLASKGYRKKTRMNYRLQIKWFLEWYRQNPAR